MKTFKEYAEACWDDYKQVGTKKKNGKEVPNCVPEEVAANSVASGGVDMNPTGKIKKLDKRSRFAIEKMYKRSQG
jgi:hypothetical protein